MKKKKSLFCVWLLVCLFAVSVVVVEAATALTVDEFKEKMEDLGYTAYSFGDNAYAYPEDASLYDSDETYAFSVYESADVAQDTLDEMYEDTEDYDSLKRTSVTSGNISCISISGEEDGVYGYAMACRIDDTIVVGTTTEKDKTDDVKNVMKELGYYTSAGIILYIVIGVVVAIVVVVVIYFLTKKKGNNMNNGGMYYGQSQPMNQGNNFGQPQPMNQSNNFGQPQPMNQSNNFGQPQPMNQGMNFGQPQPMNQNNNFNQQNNGQF